MIIKEKQVTIFFLMFYLFVISCTLITAQSQIDTKIIIEQLKSEKWIDRSKAVEALGKSKDASAVDILIEAINDKHPFVRLRAIEALSNIKNIKAIPSLINALNDSDLNVQKAAIEALGEIRAIEAIDPLISKLKYNYSGIKWRAAEALGKIKTPKASEALIAALQDENSDVRSEAAYALGVIKDKRAVEFLINVLKDESEDVRFEAVIALGNIGDSRAVEPLILLLIDKNNDVSSEAKTALVKIGEPAINPLIDKLKDKRFSDKAIKSLVLIGNISADPLIKMIKDKDYRIRDGLAEILTKLKYDPANANEKISFMIAKRDWSGCAKMGKEAVPRLINMLNDENGYIRIGAMEALGDIGDRRAIESILSIYIKTPMKRLNEIYAAKDALAKIGPEAIEPCINAIRVKRLLVNWAAFIFVKIGKPAVEPLTALLDDKDINVRTAAFVSLGKLKDSNTLDSILMTINNNINAGVGNGHDINADIRHIQIETLGNIGDTAAIDTLIKLLDSQQYRIPEYAERSLAQLGWVPKSIEEKVSYYIARSEWDKLASLGEPAVKILVNKLIGGNRIAVSALTNIGEPAVEVLIDSLNNDDIKARTEVIETLGNIGDCRAIDPLIDIVNNENGDIRFSAARALNSIKDKRSKDFLITLDNDKDYVVREIAIQLLIETNNPPIDLLITRIKYKRDGNRSACYSLTKIGTPAVEKLIIALEDSTMYTRENAVYILGQIKDKRAVPPLIDKLNDRDMKVKLNVVSALEKIGDTSAVKPLIGMLKDKNDKFRKAVVETLIKLKWVPSNDEEKAAYYISAKYQEEELEKAGELHQKAYELCKDEKYEEAISYGKKALLILEKYGHYYPTQGIFNVLDECYWKTGNYKEVELLNVRAIDYYNKNNGESYQKTEAANNLARLYIKTGRYAETEPPFLQILGSCMKFEGWLSRMIPVYANNLAITYAATEKYALAHTSFKFVLDTRKKNIDNILSQISERQKLEYIFTINSELSYFLSHIAQYQTKNINSIRDGLDALLQWKGKVTESQSRYEELISDIKDPKVLKDYSRLIEVKRDTVKLTFSGPGKMDEKEYIKQLYILEEEKKRIERRLRKISKSYALENSIGQLDSKSIAKALPEGSYLIEFACPEFYNFKDRKLEEAHYLAFILFSDERIPVGLVDLGKADNINKLIEEYRMKVKGIAEEEEGERKTNVSGNRDLRDIKIEGVLRESKKSRDEMARKLYNELFAPLKDYIGEGKNIFISPEGSLNFIPFEVLISSDGKYLIDEYQFNYITAGRDIMRFTTGNEASNKEMVIMADPDFDIGTDKDNIILSKLNFGEKGIKENIQYSREMRGINFGRISGTREEGEAINKILNEKYKKEPKLYLGDQALEGILMNNKNPKILHIASHGFFLTDDMMDMLTSSVQDNTKGLSAEEMRDILIVEDKADKKLPKIGNPMLRSGIVLSGANTSLNSGRDKGILVSEKISWLKLRGTELVVLSACDTGVGEVKKGEGVFGLKRAFILAGAKTLVMSLWKVPDEETKDLMIDFYKNMADGKGKAEALREAKLKIKEKNSNPFYWGGFISIGDPN